MTRFLVSGGTGFLGSRLARALARRAGTAPDPHARPAPDAIALLIRPERPIRGSRLDHPDSGIGPAAAILRGDLERPETCADAIARFRPDVVIHAAWNGVARAARESSAQWSNVRATIEFAHVCADAGARTWIGVGSQAEYGPAEGPVSESRPPRPDTAYGAAKLAAGAAAAEVCRARGVRFAWTRLFAVYGPGDQPDWFIPALIRGLLARRPPAMTAGTQRWDYLHVDDAADALVALADNPAAEGIFNLGSGASRPIREIAGMIRDRVAPGLPLEFGTLPAPPGAVQRMEADVERLVRATGWRPRIELETGLDQTVAWFRARAEEPES